MANVSSLVVTVGPKPTLQLWGWQLQMHHLIMSEEIDRCCTNILIHPGKCWDPERGRMSEASPCGKTDFTMKMVCNFPHLVWGIREVSELKHLKQRLDGGWTGHTLIVDRLRATEETWSTVEKEIHTFLQYEYKGKLMKDICKHVLVLSPWYPALGCGLIERWGLLGVRECKGGIYVLRSMDNEECMSGYREQMPSGRGL